MTFATEKARVGRQPVTLVEIVLDKCANVYGTSPCTASLATGYECRNTRKTCQDGINYLNTSTQTYKFSDRLIPGSDYLPCIVRTSLSPVKITPGQPFGQRAKIEITLSDFPHHDRGIDPYVTTRPYTPEEQGTFWGKLIASNPYFQGRSLLLKKGYIDETGTLQTSTEYYVIEDISGLDSNGNAKIIAKDILKLADDERAQCPVASTGKLTAAISAAATSLTVTSGTEHEYKSADTVVNGGFDSDTGWYSSGDSNISGGTLNLTAPTGNRKIYNTAGVANDYTVAQRITFTISNSTASVGVRIRLYDKNHGYLYWFGTTDYVTDGTYHVDIPANDAIADFIVGFYWASSNTGGMSIDDVSCGEADEYIRIGDEVILAPYANRTANVFANLTRNAWNTIAASHALGDAVQACKYYNARNVVDICKDQIARHARIDATYIPTADWVTEKDTWFSGHNLTALITEPTGVKTLLDEISEQMMLFMWWDSINQEIKLKAIAPPTAASLTLTDGANFVGTPSVKTIPNDRKSRVVIFYNPRNPLNFKAVKDFDSVYGDIGNDSESADQNGDIRLKVIYARWITSDSVAVTTGSRLLNQFKATPKTITFIMDAKDTDSQTGDFVNLDTRQLQGETGANEVTLARILSVEELTKDAPGTHFKYIAQPSVFAGRYAKIMSSGSSSVYSSATNAEKESGAYIAASGGADFADGGSGYKIA